MPSISYKNEIAIRLKLKLKVAEDVYLSNLKTARGEKSNHAVVINIAGTPNHRLAGLTCSELETYQHLTSRSRD